MNGTSRFLEKPNLPSSNVCLMLVSRRAKEILSMPLNKLGVEVFSLKPSKHCDARVADHPDISVCHVGGENFAVSDEQHDRLLYNMYGIKAIDTNVLISNYKETCLNAVLLDNNFIHNLKHTSLELLNIIDGRGYRKIHVNQGYSKCSVCIVAQNAIITEDIAIHKTAINAGIDSLLIKKGYVSLEGFPYGFIGGASGLVAPNRLAFTGKIDLHPDQDKILEFLYAHNVEPVFLTEQQIFDVGSLLPVKEHFREVREIITNNYIK